jgi:signal transduction histidine kinase
LGLFIARQILEKNEGRIEVDSTPGVGSLFSVRLPVTAAGIDPARGPENRAVDT